MSERLPHGYFDKLTRSIWNLGKLSMSEMIEHAPKPSVVKREIYDENYCIEPKFLVRHEAPEVFELTPKHISISLSEMQPYERNEKFTIYTFQHLFLDVQRRRRSYYTGIEMYDKLGGVISPCLELPALGVAYRPGNKDWREILPRLEPTFGKHEADKLLDIVEGAARRIHED